MLDFNESIAQGNKISERLNLIIDTALTQEKQGKGDRRYLGASRLGNPCSRALQYEYIGGNGEPNIDAQTLRIFEVGHLFEGLAARWLRLAGFELETHDDQGKQFGFTVAASRIAGHIDGVVRAAPLALTLSCPALWEAKSMNSKSWKDTAKKGLALSKPLYAAQIALYQAYMEASIPGISENPCLFTAINKDSCEIYHELVPFDSGLAQRMSDKAVNIIKAIESEELLPRSFTNRDYYECKTCPYQHKCRSEP